MTLCCRISTVSSFREMTVTEIRPAKKREELVSKANTEQEMVCKKYFSYKLRIVYVCVCMRVHVCVHVSVICGCSQDHGLTPRPFEREGRGGEGTHCVRGMRYFPGKRYEFVLLSVHYSANLTIDFHSLPKTQQVYLNSLLWTPIVTNLAIKSDKI